MVDKKAIVFPGSGAQCFQMGQQLPSFPRLLKKASSILETDLVSFNADSVKYQSDSPLAQVSLMLAGYAYFLELCQRERVDYILGQSSGQLTGALVSGMLPFEVAVKLAYQMARIEGNLAVINVHTGLLSCDYLSLEMAQIIANQISFEGKLALAVVNSPINLIFGGDIAVLNELANQLTEAGGYCRRLNMPAFHTKFIGKIDAEIFPMIHRIVSTVREPEVPFISDLDNGWNTAHNWLGKLSVQDNQRSNLAQNVKTLVGMKVTKFYTVDCGSRLSTLVNNTLIGLELPLRAINLTNENL